MKNLSQRQARTKRPLAPHVEGGRRGETMADRYRVADAETRAFLQLLRRKPPPKIDGLLKLMNEVPKEFAKDEQRLLTESEAGQQLGRAIVQCQGIRAKIKAKRNEPVREGEMEARKKEIKEGTEKYIDCITYLACNTRWKNYTRCWTALNEMDPSQLREMQAQGGIEVFCQSERQSLERCVGNLVSGAVRASDASPFIDSELENEHSSFQ